MLKLLGRGKRGGGNLAPPRLPFVILFFFLLLYFIAHFFEAEGCGIKTRVEDLGAIRYAQTITIGAKPQNIYLFRLNDSIKWTPAMFLAWIIVLWVTHKWRAVTATWPLMYQIQCLCRVQRLSQMLKLFVLVNKLNFTVILYFYYATCILREKELIWFGLPVSLVNSTAECREVANSFGTDTSFKWLS